jgi:hypothetical protein
MQEEIFKSNCISCHSEDTNAIFVVETEGIPPGQEGHQITYSRCVLYLCNSCKRGQLENMRHDCFDFEEVFDQYDWYIIEPSDMLQLSTILKNCPDSFVSNCNCSIHKALRASCHLLRTTYWDTALEHFAPDSHIHKLSLKIKKGLPELLIDT